MIPANQCCRMQWQPQDFYLSEVSACGQYQHDRASILNDAQISFFKFYWRASWYDGLECQMIW